MELILTDQQRLDVYKLVLDYFYKPTKITGLCSLLRRAIDAKYSEYFCREYYDLAEQFPEIFNQNPRGSTSFRSYWFVPGERPPRIIIVQNAISQLKQELYEE